MQYLLRRLPRRRIHAEARDGFGGINAAVYERTRPGYPREALEVLQTKIISSDHGKSVVDLGCGTGKFTRQIFPFLKKEGLEVIGVEPVEAMRLEFKKALPEIRIIEGTGDAIPLPTGSARAVVAAQSFHWMATPTVVKEVHRVLARGGLFALLWNTRDVSAPWVRALDDIIDPFYGADVPRQHGGHWRKAFLSCREGNKEQGSPVEALFGPIAEEHFHHSQWLTVRELESRLRSISVIATRPEGEQMETARRVQELVETHDDTRASIQSRGGVDLPYDTEVFWCRKLGKA